MEQSKPWDTNGIDGVNRFLRKLWNIFGKRSATERDAKEKKIMHTLIKKVSQDIENFSFNTSVAAFMIAVNELGKLPAVSTQSMDEFARLIAPFAPHIAEEFWHQLGNEGSVSDSEWPGWDEEALKEDTVRYPVQFNGKMRFNIEVPAGSGKAEVEAAVLADPAAEKWLEGRTPKKVIVVPGRIVNIVI